MNWNSIDDTLALLSSIQRSTYPKNKYEIWIIDNGSTDDSILKIKKNYPKVKLIALKKNVGIWARNYALKKVKGEIIVTLDSDAYLTKKNTLEKLVLKLMEDDSIGIIGAKVISKRPGIFSPMYLNFYTGVISVGNLDKSTTNATWVAFIFSAFRKSTLKKVGLTYRAFAYGEDLNYCLRIKKLGLKILYYPKVEVLHYKRKSTWDVPFDEKYKHYYKAIFRNIFEFGNVFQKISVCLFQLFIIPAYYLILGKTNQIQLKEKYWGFWWNIKNQ